MQTSRPRSRTVQDTVEPDRCRKLLLAAECLREADEPSRSMSSWLFNGCGFFKEKLVVALDPALSVLSKNGSIHVKLSSHSEGHITPGPFVLSSDLRGAAAWLRGAQIKEVSTPVVGPR